MQEIKPEDLARIKFVLETAPNGLAVDNILRNIRKLGSSMPIKQLEQHLVSKYESGAIRRWNHPVKEGEYLFGCLLEEARA